MWCTAAGQPRWIPTESTEWLVHPVTLQSPSVLHQSWMCVKYTECLKPITNQGLLVSVQSSRKWIYSFIKNIWLAYIEGSIIENRRRWDYVLLAASFNKYTVLQVCLVSFVQTLFCTVEYLPLSQTRQIWIRYIILFTRPQIGRNY